MSQQAGNRTVFRRIGGRIVPIQVRKEVGAIAGTSSDLARAPGTASAVAKIVAATAGGLALTFGAGKLKKVSEMLLKSHNTANLGEVAERVAKVGDFTGKAGAGLVAGHGVTQLDRSTTRDEKSKLLNLGAQGTGAVGLGASLAFGYGFYRVAKRFQKWGYYGGKFPRKLRDL